MRYSDLTESRRPWRRYHTRSTGFCALFRDGIHKGVGIYETGSVTTGKTEVEAGVFVRIQTPSGNEFLAEDVGSPVGALFEVRNRLFAGEGWAIDAAGLDDAFSQSPMGYGTPWGHHPQFQGAVHMMEPLVGRISIGDADLPSRS